MQSNVMRGTPLSIFIVVATATSIIGVVGYLFSWNLLISSMGVTITYSLFFVALARWYALYLMWGMYRLGYILYLLLTLISFALTFYLQQKISNAYFVTAFVLAILVYLLKNKWSEMPFAPAYFKLKNS